MEERSSRPKRVGNHYIPPPARTRGVEINESTRHKERPVKLPENVGVKLCNDSSLLFRDGDDNKKDNSRKPRKSKRSSKKADAENASVRREKEFPEPINSNALIDRVIKCQPDRTSDIRVERVAAVSHPLTDLENKSLPHTAVNELVDSCANVDDSHSRSYQHPVKTDEVINAQEKEELAVMRPEVLEATEETKNEEINKAIIIAEQTITSLSLNEVNGDDTTADESEVKSLGIIEEPVQTNGSANEPLNVPSQDIPVLKALCNGEPRDPAVDNVSELVQLICPKEPEPSTKGILSSQSTTPQKKAEDNDGDDWLTIYDDAGEFWISPDPDQNALLTSKTVSKGKPDVKKVTDEERTQETSSIIEIYGFSEDLKTSDLMMVFGHWTQRGFNLKWVDNTHALGIFPTPALAEEALGSNIPLVKLRPISQGIPLSQERARTLVLPSTMRPKTCTALARRLVSGALGLRVNVSPEERAAERELLREAREKKKLVMKQRDAVWEGNFSSFDNGKDKASD